MATSSRPCVEGRRFSSFIDELGWPETEVKLFLKARSPVLALGSTRDKILDQVPSRVVFQRPASVTALDGMPRKTARRDQTSSPDRGLAFIPKTYERPV